MTEAMHFIRKIKNDTESRNDHHSQEKKMNNKLKGKFNLIKRTNNNMHDSKKNLKIEIICCIIMASVLGAAYYFYRNLEVLVCAVLAPTAMIVYCIYAYFKEKRHDKSSANDKQEFLSGSKFRKKEWKTAYYEYKEKHSFEEISKKGMKHDLIKRYRTGNNRGLAEVGLLLFAGSIAAVFYPIKDFHFGYSILGILFGGAFMSYGIYNYTGGPVRKFCKTRDDLPEIEKSYNKGKMLSYKPNGLSSSGINLGSTYTVIFNSNKVIAVENRTIEDMVRKMVRVKKYENNVYSGQEYNYYVSVIYRKPDGREAHTDVRLDEFQCEMMIAEFHRSFYPEKMYDSIVSETNDDTVVTP